MRLGTGELMEAFNIRYDIIGREDGRWTIQAFDRNDKKLGVKITCNTPGDCWKIWLMLNGYSYEVLESTVTHELVESTFTNDKVAA